jgi:hypothetical protein
VPGAEVMLRLLECIKNKYFLKVALLFHAFYNVLQTAKASSIEQDIVTCYCCVSTLSRNNAILSDATVMDSLSFHCHTTMYQAVIDFHSNEFCCLRTPIGLKS